MICPWCKKDITPGRKLEGYPDETKRMMFDPWICPACREEIELWIVGDIGSRNVIVTKAEVKK